ncbi:MAG: adenylate cyclase regulatory domain-containing protein [Solirubrobacteraceae bacterium]
MDFAAEGLLDDLEGEERTARRELLERLAQDGFSLDELRSAVKEKRLVLLPLDRVLGGSVTANEAEAQTGLPAEVLLRMRRLLGLPAAGPDDRVFSDEEVEAARSTKRFLDAGFDDDAIVEITRVLGEGMGRLAATITAAFADAFLSPGDSEEAVAERFAALAQQLTPVFTPVLVAGFKAQLRDSVGRGVLGRDELQAGDVAGAQELAVCFADLVGFTRLGGQVELTELGTVAGQLARLAASVVQAPVRLIKTIGDAAMFVSPEPGPLIEVALSLVEAVEEADLPSLRAGLAYGPALVRAGDYYGNSVNLASRVTGVARPGTVLCTQEVRDHAGEGLRWSSAGRHRLKGVSGGVALHRARRATADGDDGPDDQSEDAATRRRAGRSRKRGPS